MESPAEFVLRCNGAKEPIACHIEGRVAALGRDNLLAARVSPPLPTGIGSDEVAMVVLVPRTASAWPWEADGGPVPVYVCQAIEVPESPPQLVVVAWCTLHAAGSAENARPQSSGE